MSNRSEVLCERPSVPIRTRLGIEHGVTLWKKDLGCFLCLFAFHWSAIAYWWMPIPLSFCFRSISYPTVNPKRSLQIQGTGLYWCTLSKHESEELFAFHQCPRSLCLALSESMKSITSILCRNAWPLCAAEEGVSQKSRGRLWSCRHQIRLLCPLSELCGHVLKSCEKNRYAVCPQVSKREGALAI